MTRPIRTLFGIPLQYRGSPLHRQPKRNQHMSKSSMLLRTGSRPRISRVFSAKI